MPAGGLYLSMDPLLSELSVNCRAGSRSTDPGATDFSVVANGLQRFHDLYTVTLGGGQPVSLQGFLRRCLGITLRIPRVDVQPQHDSFVAGCLHLPAGRPESGANARLPLQRLAGAGT